MAQVGGYQVGRWIWMVSTIVVSYWTGMQCKMFPIHTSSSILIGVLVGATSLWHCMVCCGSFTENNANREWTLWQEDVVVLFADVKSRGYNENTHSGK